MNSLSGMIRAGLDNPKLLLGGAVTAAGIYALKKTSSNGAEKMMAEMDHFMATQAAQKGMSTGGIAAIVGGVFTALSGIALAIGFGLQRGEMKESKKSFGNVVKALWYKLTGDKQKLGSLVHKPSGNQKGGASTANTGGSKKNKRGTFEKDWRDKEPEIKKKYNETKTKKTELKDKMQKHEKTIADNRDLMNHAQNQADIAQVQKILKKLNELDLEIAKKTATIQDRDKSRVKVGKSVVTLRGDRDTLVSQRDAQKAQLSAPMHDQYSDADIDALLRNPGLYNDAYIQQHFESKVVKEMTELAQFKTQYAAAKAEYIEAKEVWYRHEAAKDAAVDKDQALRERDDAQEALQIERKEKADLKKKYDDLVIQQSSQ